MAKYEVRDIDQTAEIAALKSENARLQELLRGIGANRYWEERWRDADKENAKLREDLEGERYAAAHLQKARDDAEVEIAKLRVENQQYRDSLLISKEIARLRSALVAAADVLLEIETESDEPAIATLAGKADEKARRALEDGK